MHQDPEIQKHTPGNAASRGYPQYAALLASDDVFRVFRRFTAVRMRLLLAQQDKVSILEQKLNDIDQKESRPLFLGSMRLDRNSERQAVMVKLKFAVKEYDEMLEKLHFVTNLPDPDDQEVDNLKKWILGTGFDQRETSYLKKSDLASFAGSNDRAVKIVEAFVERKTASLYDSIGKLVVSLVFVPRFPSLQLKPAPLVSNDSVQVFILSPFMKGFSRVVAICLVSLIMLVPTIVLPRLTTQAQRTTLSVITAAVVLVSVAFFTRARTIELVACGASYTAVIVALTVAGPGTDNCN